MLEFWKRKHEVAVPPPSSGARAMGLAASAVVGCAHGESAAWLHGGPPNTARAKRATAMLATFWDVTDRASCLVLMQWLGTTGDRTRLEVHRQRIHVANGNTALEALYTAEQVGSMSDDEKDCARYRIALAVRRPELAGWDLCRLIAVARLGAAAGFLRDDEAWTQIERATEWLRMTFASWAELGESYVVGHAFWDGAEDPAVRGRVDMLLAGTARTSPWVATPWSDVDSFAGADALTPAAFARPTMTRPPMPA